MTLQTLRMLWQKQKRILGKRRRHWQRIKSFLKKLKELCTDADENFQERKAMRLKEIQAVSETIEILTADEARDAMTGTYNFLQTSATSNKKRLTAAKALREAAAKHHHDP